LRGQKVEAASPLNPSTFQPLNFLGANAKDLTAFVVAARSASGV
jgi:hypothetical protein